LERLQAAMKEAGLDAIACSLPSNVLLLSGYFPVLGTSVAVAQRDCSLTLLVPEDEQELAEPANADRLITFPRDGAGTLWKEIEGLGLAERAVGYDGGPAEEPVSYASMHLYASAMRELLDCSDLRSCPELLARMKAVLTPIEIDRVRRACRIAEIAFERGTQELAVGARESEAAARYRVPLTAVGIGFEGVRRADGFVSCMSGPNSAQAWGAYARSRAKEICIGDLVLTHCNSHADGYWTDITRTYCMGPPDERQRCMFEAMMEARAAALDAIRPGVTAGEVDAAARDCLRARGFGDAFKHSTGHGVGFAAIDANAHPRIRAGSPDRLECGMVFNIEPGIYLEGFGGMRHCDMVAVTETGVEVLTGFHSSVDRLTR
jgi:Xaa-Pro dipeptidase